MILGADVQSISPSLRLRWYAAVHLLAHVYLNKPLSEKDIWKLYRGAYRGEPFIRLVASKTGLHRFPNRASSPGQTLSILASNSTSRPMAPGTHLVVMAALDNLGKGAAGSGRSSANEPHARR